MNIEIPANTTQILNQADLPLGEVTIILAENAKLIQYQFINTDQDFAQKILVRQHANSHFEQHYINIQSNKSTRAIEVILQEPGASCILTGMYVANSDANITNKITINHAAKKCHSMQDYRGVLLDNANVSLDSVVHVHAHASLTDAKQHSKHLMASNRANIKVSPSLEIFHDDVICAHGASIGELDANMVFYLQSRGLTQDAARALIIKGFLTSHLAYIPDPVVKRELELAMQENWFGHIVEIEA